MNDQIFEMLHLQDSMNAKVDRDWRSAGFEWHRAIWTEAAELLDHIGWKWWKKQEPNVEQCKLEIIDIWHFVFSASIKTDRSQGYSQTIEEISEAFLMFSERPMLVKVGLLEMVEHFALDTLLSRRADPFKLVAIMYMLDMSFDELYRQYIAKNVLNFFRQDNGYKEGTYEKIWFGREDNEHLSDIIGSIPEAEEDFAKVVRYMLEKLYAQATGSPEPGTQEYNREVLGQNNEGDTIGGDSTETETDGESETADNTEASDVEPSTLEQQSEAESDGDTTASQ